MKKKLKLNLTSEKVDDQRSIGSRNPERGMTRVVAGRRQCEPIQQSRPSWIGCRPPPSRSAEALSRAVSGRTAQGIRSGPAPTQHRASHSGEGLRRPSRRDPAAARSVGEGRLGQTRRPAGIAPADQAGLRTGADLESADLPGHGHWRMALPMTARPLPACPRSPPRSPAPNGTDPGSLACDPPAPWMEATADGE